VRSFNVWLYRIARNKVYDRFRRKKRFVSLPEDNDIPVSGNDEPVFDANDAEDLHRALNELKPYHREVLTLGFIEQMSYQSIADVVGCEIGTVRSRIHYAKQSLRKELEARQKAEGRRQKAEVMVSPSARLFYGVIKWITIKNYLKDC